MTISAIVNEQLSVLAATVAMKYTPLRFRQYLNVVPLVPGWAQQGQYIKIEVTSDMKRVSNFDNRVPLASHKRSSRYFDLVEFANGYMVMRGEQERAAQEPGYQLDTTLALANQRMAEWTQSQMAFLGKDADGAVGNCRGILNLADTSTITKEELGTTTTFVKADGTLTTNGADAAKLLAFIDNMIQAYTDAAGESVLPAHFAIPKWQWKAFNARSTITNERVIDIARANYPTLNFFELTQANEVSASGVDRFAMWSNDEEVQRCIIPEEYHDLPASADAMQNVLVPSVMKAGGVISNYPQGVLYADMDRADVS